MNPRVTPQQRPHNLRRQGASSRSRPARTTIESTATIHFHSLNCPSSSILCSRAEGGRCGVDPPARRRRRGNAMIAGESVTRTGGCGPVSDDLFSEISKIQEEKALGLTRVFRPRYITLRLYLVDAREGPFDEPAMTAQPCVSAWVGF
jgi:hypothetical protein